MSSKKLDGHRVAILSADGFEQSELFEPRKALLEAGAEVVIVSPNESSIKGWNKKDWGESIAVDQLLSEADASTFDALMLPGGVMNPDKLRIDSDAISFAKHFVDSGKPIAAICHGPQLLIEAEGVRGRKMTSYPAIKSDLIHAGARWEDAEAVTDGPLLTSRKPDDLPVFNTRMIELFAEGPQVVKNQGRGVSESLEGFSPS